MTMAGKAAEIIKWGDERVSNGPAGDIQQASAIARAMVMRWGMSDKVGNIDYAEAHEGYQGNTGGFSVSAKTKELIEEEVRELIEEGYQRARVILLEKTEDFERRNRHRRHRGPALADRHPQDRAAAAGQGRTGDRADRLSGGKRCRGRAVGPPFACRARARPR
jgi:hypothetical protein